ncbi:MAG: hypothetical protein J0H54_00665 [Rhizobiales bacterium]|nr:hypothetical protein [Hyphomicrobiales bacterium]
MATLFDCWKMRLTGSVSLRPVRLGFLVPPDDLSIVSRVARLAACVWGGRYCPIIPFFENGGDHWSALHSLTKGLDVARGYIDFFEPDTLVEAVPGMAEQLGWNDDRFKIGLPRIVPLQQFFEVDDRGHVNFAAGIDIVEAMQELFDREFKYQRRHTRPFAIVDESDGDTFFDLVGGRYPQDEALGHIRHAYKEVFSAQPLPAEAETALKFVRNGSAGPLWITRHGLEESYGRGSRDYTFFIFDPGNAGDAIDYWNFRLVEQHVSPINVQWLAQHRDFIREHILETFRPIPGNRSGMKFRTTLMFGASISEERRKSLWTEHFSGLPDGSVSGTHPPSLSMYSRRNYGPRESKLLVSAASASFDETLSPDRYVKLPALTPSFANATKIYRHAHWINVIATGLPIFGDEAATVYPSNLWTPGYPRLAAAENMRTGREGWVLSKEYRTDYSLLRPENGRDAIVGWLKSQGIEAEPSPEGQIAAQVIAATGGVAQAGIFANRQTVELLDEMAENHAEVSRGGKRVISTVPDRAKHVHTIKAHFAARAKGTFGFGGGLERYLKANVFRAGLRVQCPVCQYQNWYDLDSLTYRPTCTRCLNQFDFAQTPEALKGVNWFYRVIGPFAAPNYAGGGYAVALTLRALALPDRAEMTWSTGLRLQPLNREVDFIGWQRRRGILDDERDEPLLVLGEAKSFGRGVFDAETGDGLKQVAERFPGAVMVVSSLRTISEYMPEEIDVLRDLALWGRREVFRDHARNPLIVLTGTELFADYGIFNAWQKQDGKRVHSVHDESDLLELSDLTLARYLGMQGYWAQRFAERSLPHQRARLTRLIKARALSR